MPIERSKKKLLYEFSQTPQARNCRSLVDLEKRFSAWMRHNNIDLVNRGRSYWDNDFYASANYTKKLLKEDIGLLYAFGLNESHLIHCKPEYRDNTKDGYSLLGQFKHYGNQAHNRGQNGEYLKKGVAASGIGKVILGIIILVAVYSLVGDTIWAMITEGVIFKLICYAIAAFISYKILRSKNMGWPLPIKLIVLFVIWLVLSKYNF